jgi:peptidyl-prolyl cis-trans isomerase D
VVYTVLEQKISTMDQNQSNFVKDTTTKIKRATFESNLIQMLDKKYPTEVYMGGLKN